MAGPLPPGLGGGALAGRRLRRVAAAAAALVAVITSPAAAQEGRMDASGPYLRPTAWVGRSVEDRPIPVYRRGRAGTADAVLVVGCIHGTERAGIPIANRLLQVGALAHSTLWVLPDLNPDGAAANTRPNLDGVDLNRNFPFAYQYLGSDGDAEYAGTGVLSEPEARFVHALIERIRPAVTIWFHQPFGVVDLSGGDPAIERRYSRLSGLPLRLLTRYHGSAASWQDHALRGTTAFVVELPAGDPTPAEIERHVQAVRTLALEVAQARTAAIARTAVRTAIEGACRIGVATGGPGLDACAALPPTPVREGPGTR
jgi:protein MpaA